MSIKGQGHSLTLVVKGHSDSKLKLVFLINSWAIWNQISYESLREDRNEKDKVHEGIKSALLQKLMKFGNLICVCLR